MKYLGEKDGVRTWSLNDDDREEWIANNEGLLTWRRRYPTLSMRQFIAAHRDELTRLILAELRKEPEK